MTHRQPPSADGGDGRSGLLGASEARMRQADDERRAYLDQAVAREREQVRAYLADAARRRGERMKDMYRKGRARPPRLPTGEK